MPFFGLSAEEIDRLTIAAKVNAVNATNAIINEWHPKLAEFFRPFVGKKVIRNTGVGGYNKELAKGIQLDLPCGDVSIYWQAYASLLKFNVKTDVLVTGKYWYQHKDAFDVGKIAKDYETLESILPLPTELRRTDITLEEILEKMDTFERLREELPFWTNSIQYIHRGS